MGDKVFKLVGAGVAFGATVLARQIATKGWKAVMNEEPPANPEDPDTEMWQALVWAVVSGAVIAIVRLMATRKWTQYFTASTGKRPSNPDDVS
ncbi:DUF4235 domain-containing protein [Agilicoccus flavus]|uniref:DUF4235 domain-containing protein n=1 Tax=Agilicoccus flavus TaxID=2775968 RepID=UPI001CF6D941|nr:DUF4235 domain-containing protein [Agilicoccus flavus]